MKLPELTEKITSFLEYVDNIILCYFIFLFDYFKYPQNTFQIFLFPKSPTGGDLKTVLLVSEDDDKRDGFHESLFLPRSPRMTEQRRKRIKTSAYEDKRFVLKTACSQESSVL